MRLYSSTFISIVLAFLMFMGYQGQPVELADDTVTPDFTYTFRQEGPAEPDRVRIEIFDDLTCADCTDFVKNTLPKIKALAQETDKIDLRLYFVPNRSVETFYQSALALKCAADQDGFWGMYEKIHDNKEDLDLKILMKSGEELELNTKALSDCVEERTHEKAVQNDYEYASLNPAIARPVLLINQYKLVGHPPFENIKKIINEYLKSEPPVVKTDDTDSKTDLKQELEDVSLPTTNL